MVYVNTNDLKHILDQIFVAEQHASGTPMTDLLANPLLSQGLRLVDGTLNNITPGRETSGSADQVMPRLLDSTFLTQPDAAHLADPSPRAPQNGPTSYLQTSGSVYDADPRIISNLIADQTLANPAAIAAKLSQNGMTGQEMLAAANQVSIAHRIAIEAQATAGNVDAAIEQQLGVLTMAVNAAQSALDAANTDVSAKAELKTTADAMLTTQQANLAAASDVLIALQNIGAVGEAQTALQDAQASLVSAETTLSQVEIDFAAAETTATNARLARDAKVLEIANLEASKINAGVTLAGAQAELSTLQNALVGMTVTTGLAEAQQAVSLALASIAPAELAVLDVNSRLQTAQDELATLNSDLVAAEADVITRTTALDSAKQDAITSQAEVDVAQIVNDAESAEAASAQVAFLDAFAVWTADRGNYVNTALMSNAATIMAAERAEATLAAEALAAATTLDDGADATATAAQVALNTANDLVISTTAQRDTAKVAVDALFLEQVINATALTDAQTAFDAAQNTLSAAMLANSAYIAAELAVANAAQGVMDAEQAVADNAVATTAAKVELVGLNNELSTAAGEVTRLSDAATIALGVVTTAAGVVSQAEAEVAAAQAASLEIASAVEMVGTASIAHSVAIGAAATAATDLATAEANVVTLGTTLDQANAALDALNAPGASAAALVVAEAAAAEAQTALDTLLTSHGIEMDGNNLRILDVSPDEGLSAGYNSWMTLFGQFFDHGLDLVGKGGSGTVYIPLMPDDPLYVEGSPTNFMVLTRATNHPGQDGILGTADDVREHSNATTPWVDQNQTYTSHASHQVFLREYELDANGRPVATGNLLSGDTGGQSTWGDVKAQAANLLGIQLDDSDVHDGPLLATDPYGNFIPSANGMPQLVVVNPAFATDPNQPEFIMVEGDTANPVDASQAVRNGHAFLSDISRNAEPGTYVVDRFTGETAVKLPDADTDTGNAIIPNQFGQNATYDNELLDRHFIAGDGRGNENFGLTAVHHIFHNEHNRQVMEMKQTIIDSGELAFINEWLSEPVDTTGIAGITAIDDLAWNGERLFQAAKFATEMQYQHLAFEEFGRRVQPQIAPFMVNSSLEIDGAIFAEFAHVVYRFGHSMLTENVQTMDSVGVNTSTDLITAFLNPLAYDQDGAITADNAAGSVVRGMSREVGSNIDEFVTSALRDNLVGLPLDLAALNIARGRDTGVPSLNAAREQFYAATGSEFLKPYETWADYAANLKNPASVVNFIAAYGAHENITSATTVADKRAAAMELVLGGEGAPNDRLDFVNGTGVWANAETGINDVEFWIGGLAESIMPFGGMLGSTFGFVFQTQMENLQNADRFYYLSRTNGMNMIGELENNSFASMIIRNTDIKDGGAHISADIFAAMQYILEVDTSVQTIEDPVSIDVDPFMAAMGTNLVERETAAPDAPLVDGQLEYDNKLQFNGGDHVVLGGTSQRDILVGGLGDDALWGDAGNDLLIGGSGVNTFRGGDGDDIIKDGDDVSFLHGEDGNDVISAGGGAGELIFGGRGSDVIMMGSDDAKHAFAGMGNDFVLGGAGVDIVDGGEGDDWIEGGDGFDFLFGDNNDNMGASRVQGHDVLWGGPNDNDLHGESGDDILVQGEGTHVNLAELGYDWIVHKDANSGAEVDLTKRIETEQAEFFKDRYIDAEAVSGTQHDDLIWGDNRIGDGAPIDGLVLDNEITLFAHELTQEGVDRIDGLRDFLGNLMGVNPSDMFIGGNILLGGGGSDVIQGRGGDDVIDGDKMLNVRISIRDVNDANVEIQTVDSLREILPQLLDGTISPLQLQITREILDAGQEGDVDVAVYYDVRDNYSITSNTDGSVMVSHINVTPGPVLIDPINGRPNPLVGDGTDRLTNVEILRFADQEIDLRINPPTDGIIFGTPQDDNLFGSNATDVIFADGGNDEINGNAGNDIIFGEGGNDLIVWDAPNGGYDIVSGGGMRDGITDIDMLVINGDGNETAITMYTLAAWANVGGSAPLDPGSEIIITRTVDGVETAIMEIVGIEEVTINGVQGIGLINAIGDFTQTSLAPNTIYVNGSAGEEIIDFSGFMSTQSVVVDAGAGNDIISGGAGNDLLLGGLGADELTWGVGGGNDVADGGAGEDLYTVNGDATDEIFRVYAADAWTGEAIAADADIVITRDTGTGELVIGQLSNIEEIQINTGGGINEVQVFGNFDPTSLAFNTITVNGTDGDDSVDITDLTSAHRVLLRSEGGNDTIVGHVREQDVIVLPEGTDLALVVRTVDDNGVVTLSDGIRSVSFTPQEPDVEPGVVVAGTAAEARLVQLGTVNEAGVFQLPRGEIALTQIDIDALKYMVTGQGTPPALPLEEGEEPGDQDELIVGVADIPGLENNLVNPEISGGATLPYIRVTEARYGGIDATGAGIINPIFDGLDPRAISNALGAQEANVDKAASANMFMMSFGQYFDHGLTFIPKGGHGKIEIGGPDTGRPSGDNPADLTRATVTGIDEEGVPEHTNITTPLVDQNQVYGSSILISQFLRESDGETGAGSHILMGGDDPSAMGFKLLSTLRESLDHHIDAGTVFKGTDMGDVTLQVYYAAEDKVLRDENGNYDASLVKQLSDDFMGEGWPLLIDTNPYINLLDHYVGGDGRANENIGLTSMHTVWARNHNYHVEQLEAAGFEGTLEEIFQAGRILNIGEYQQVVFNDFADSLLGGLQGSGGHGHDKYDPTTDARISQEFAAAAYRFGHSQIGQTLTILDAEGIPTDVNLFDAFLNPSNNVNVFQADMDRDGTVDLTGAEAVEALAQFGYTPQPGYAEYGVNAILGGLAQQPSEEIDFKVVDAVRNDLVRVSADLFAFNVARGWDVGLGTLNQVKADLAVSTNRYVSEAIELSDMAMQPYTSWEDFQARNGLSDEVIAQFKQAYPDLVLEGDKLAQFELVNPDVSLVDNSDGTKTVKGIDRVDVWVGGLAEQHIQGGVLGQTFWVLIHEQLDRLQEGDRFYYTDRIGNLPVYNNFISNVTFGDLVARNTGMTDLQDDVFSYDANAETEVPVTETEVPVTETEVPVTETEVPVTEAAEMSEDQMLVGTDMADELMGGDGNDVIRGGAGSDFLVGGAGDDMIMGGACNDDIIAGVGNDMIYGDSGNDRIFGDDGDDIIVGGTGSDMLYGGEGNDVFIGMDDDGNDIVYGGVGSDTLDLSAIADALEVRLGNAGTERGSVSGATQSDTIWSIENVIGGSGDDKIIASEAANTLDGGDGNDTYVFETMSTVAGTTIMAFSAGDVLSFSDIDANSGTEARDAFTLAGRDATIGAGELTFAHDAEDGESFTTVTGMTDQGAFELKLSGHINLEEENFLL